MVTCAQQLTTLPHPVSHYFSLFLSSSLYPPASVPPCITLFLHHCLFLVHSLFLLPLTLDLPPSLFLDQHLSLPHNVLPSLHISHFYHPSLSPFPPPLSLSLFLSLSVLSTYLFRSPISLQITLSPAHDPPFTPVLLYSILTRDAHW